MARLRELDTGRTWRVIVTGDERYRGEHYFLQPWMDDDYRGTWREPWPSSMPGRRGEGPCSCT